MVVRNSNVFMRKSRDVVARFEGFKMTKTQKEAEYLCAYLLTKSVVVVVVVVAAAARESGALKK